MPTVTRPESSPRFVVNVNLYEPGPSSTSAICIGLSIGLNDTGRCDRKKRIPPCGGVLPNSALIGVLAGLLTCLLLLAGLLARLLTLLLVRLIRLGALLRLALVVLIHVNLQKITETSFE
jgi:hypothetical protein